MSQASHSFPTVFKYKTSSIFKASYSFDQSPQITVFSDLKGFFSSFKGLCE